MNADTVHRRLKNKPMVKNQFRPLKAWWVIRLCLVMSIAQIILTQSVHFFLSSCLSEPTLCWVSCFGRVIILMVTMQALLRKFGLFIPRNYNEPVPQQDL